jgi:polyphenol oxidase
VGGDVRHVLLGDDVDVHLTSAAIDGVADANLAHHRPHAPAALAAARARVGVLTSTDPASWHLMRQVHGGAVAVVDDAPRGAELRDVDALVTTELDRPIVVLTADCLPVVLAGERGLAVVHAGWRGLVADVIGSTVDTLVAVGEDPAALHALVGPSIGPCCYEVGVEVVEALGPAAPDVRTTTRTGAPAVDLVAAARARLASFGIALDLRSWECTSCGPGGWFSHRRDPAAGRQATIAVRRARTAP